MYVVVLPALKTNCVHIFYCRCEIYGNMLNYGYLLPLGIIILHNITIFCMVLRIICKQIKPTPNYPDTCESFPNFYSNFIDHTDKYKIYIDDGKSM